MFLVTYSLRDGGESLQMRCARGRHQGAWNAAQPTGVESGSGNGIDGSTVRLASGCQPRPWLGDQVLKPAHQAVAADVLEDYQPASGCEYPTDFSQGGAHVVDRAQHQADVYRVKAVVWKGNRLADSVDDVDVNVTAVC
jgi:hypothetical protein